jgi:hypothetical protein
MPAICINRYYPGGIPLYWLHGDDRLRAAVWAYISGSEMDADALSLFRLYLRHFVAAPCWDAAIADACRKLEMTHGSVIGELDELRRGSESLSTREEIQAWLHDALDFGIDPL